MVSPVSCFGSFLQANWKAPRLHLRPRGSLFTLFSKTQKTPLPLGRESKGHLGSYLVFSFCPPLCPQVRTSAFICRFFSAWEETVPQPSQSQPSTSSPSDLCPSLWGCKRGPSPTLASPSFPHLSPQVLCACSYRSPPNPFGFPVLQVPP